VASGTYFVFVFLDYTDVFFYSVSTYYSNHDDYDEDGWEQGDMGGDIYIEINNGGVRNKRSSLRIYYISSKEVEIKLKIVEMG